MVDIRFSRNEYTWANQGIVPAMADAVELTKTIQERALEALRAHRATLGEDTAVRIYVGSTEPVGAAHGDFWWNGDSRQRKDSWAGEASRTNLFTDQRPLEAMPNHYVTNGSMSLYLGNEIRYVMTAGGEFRAGFNITGTGTHTFAFEFRSTTVSALRSFHLRTSDGAIDRYVVLPAYEEWLRVEDTVTGPVQVYLTPEAAENPDAGDVVFVKDIIVEAGADAGAFFDGAMPMCSWTGTPGLSTSTYTPGWTLAPALSDLIAILTQTSYEDGFVDIYLGPEIPLFPGEGDLWDDGAEFKVFDGMGWQILIDDTGTVIDETTRDRVKPIVGEIIDPIILPIQEDIEQIGGEVSAVSEWVNVTGAQLDANLAQAQIDLAAAQAALNAAIADLDTLENITLPALDLEITTTQGELDTLANTTIPALYTRLDEAETDLYYLSNTTLPALNTQITDAQSALNAAFPSGVFDVEGALDTTITGTVIEYAVNSSETVAPTTDWSTTQPTRTPGTFVWFRTKITYGSGTTNTSSAALLTGNTGATGPEGPQGSQGIQGPPGDDGVSTYTWLKYADTPTTGMSDTPAGKTYMGLAHNKPTATESSDYGDYQWSLIRGEDGIDGEPGIPGPPGEDGQTTYTWVKYAPNGAPTAAQMSDSPTDMTHIGLAFNKTTATESTVPTDYQWALIQGAPGADGISITSVTPYFLQQVSDTAPAKPTDSPPPAPWTTTEPTWVSGQNLYRTERIIYSDTSFVYTDVSKVAAYAAADAAMLAANSKNTNTYTDLVRPALPGGNPAVTGRRVGDVHRWRYTDNGEVIKEIILNDSNAWQDIQFGDSVLTTLDVGKLTAGTATIQTAVIQALAVEIATIIELAADRITSGTIAAGRIDTTALAAAIATIIELDAGTITSGTIDTARLNATEIAAQIATIIELNADRIVAGEIGAARINTIEMAAALANIITANIENLRVGTGTMDTAVINKLWTDVVRSRKITTDMLIVGSGDNLVADPYFVDTELSNARGARSQGTWTRANESPLDPASPLVFQVSAGSVRYLRLLGVDLSTESTWGSRVEPGTKYRVRYDYRRTGTVSTVTVRPRVRWVNHLGNVSTDTPRAAYAGTTTSWQQDEVE